MKKKIFAFFIIIVAVCLVSCTEILEDFFDELTNHTETTELNNPPYVPGIQVEEPKDDLKVHFIDVGQADCILVQNKGNNMLIDAGNNGDADTIKEYLNEQDVDKIDYLIGTHPHEDHIGSLDMVINEFEIANIMMPMKWSNTKTFSDVITAIENKKMQIIEPKVGDRYSMGDAEFIILSPAKDYEDDTNDYSVVIKLIYGDMSFMFTGDAGIEPEKDMINSGISLKANVLKFGHHGSYTASSEEFLKAVAPEYGVIMCETGNSYGHPHEETLEKIDKYNITVYRTDEQGTIVATSNGKQITWVVENET